jgi:hypothetical protein
LHYSYTKYSSLIINPNKKSLQNRCSVRYNKITRYEPYWNLVHKNLRAFFKIWLWSRVPPHHIRGWPFSALNFSATFTASALNSGVDRMIAIVHTGHFYGKHFRAIIIAHYSQQNCMQQLYKESAKSYTEVKILKSLQI